ncbi:caspase family protein [Pyxidicoccus sp. MSG2]|uniref:caspase family protein n=1 Tax=Pyxidicoccus sp. MSG2 TaxID=2996790 RepID=UPI00226E7AC3|nr:caspase family protein [Pyxidicoccus sp. MSG2]MCY1021353.1 caspase family protein [Pyxidicoccus sp. MSG2]
MSTGKVIRFSNAVPGVHALIVGVSEYPYLVGDDAEPLPHHFGLRKLTSAASTAFRIYQWLVSCGNRLPLPLASCRLLLSPSATELAKTPDMAKDAERATLANIQRAAEAWREEAKQHRSNMTLFYFAGHGLQRTRGDHVLLLDEFGESPARRLGHGLISSDLVDGMAPIPGRADIARTQLYFFDACRTATSEMRHYDKLPAGHLWDVEGLGSEAEFDDDRLSPVFFTCVPGSLAYAIPGQETVFGKALLECLEGGAGVFNPDEQKWAVTTGSISRSLAKHLVRINQYYGVNQMFRVSNLGPDAVIHYLDAPPKVPVDITLTPPEARPYTRMRISDAEDEEVLTLGAPVPEAHRELLSAGNYIVKTAVDTQADGAPVGQCLLPRSRIYSVEPPAASMPVQVRLAKG